MTKDCCVAVLSGGEGDERDVSLQSGKCVLQALQGVCSEVISSDITSADMSILDNDNIDVFFLALHGKFGEDGQLQKILEQKKLKFTGSGSAASFNSFDKAVSKKIFEENNIPTPAWVNLPEYVEEKKLAEQIRALGSKYVVKPSQQGSSVGIEILDDPLEAARAATVSLARFGPCIIEKFIKGREITAGIVGNDVLPLIEIKPATAFYDYHAKYIDDKTQYMFDTIESASVRNSISELALKTFNVLGCRHMSRVDFLLDDAGQLFVLEINTIPGMTDHSLLPKAASKAGIDMSGLCLNIVNLALGSD